LEEQIDLCKMLRLSNHHVRLVEFMHHLRHVLPPEDLVGWAHAYAHPHAQVGLQVIASRLPQEGREAFLAAHQTRQESLNGHVKRIIHKQPLVSATQLKELGIAPGPGMGALLKEAERIAITKDLEDPQAVLNLLRKQPIWTKGK
jgi:poly(A) polymerase